MSEALARGFAPKKYSVKEILFKNLSTNWVPKRELTNKHYPEGFVDGETGGRKLRELASEGKIESKIINGLAYYKRI